MIYADTPTHGLVCGSSQINNNLINLDLIEIIQFCLKIMICTDTPTHGWMGGSVGQWVASGHITKYQINLDLIEINQFCLKIYFLLRHPHLWVDGGFSGSVRGVRSYRSRMLNLNTVNSKFHLIRSFFEILARILSFHV